MEASRELWLCPREGSHSGYSDRELEEEEDGVGRYSHALKPANDSDSSTAESGQAGTTLDSDLLGTISTVSTVIDRHGFLRLEDDISEEKAQEQLPPQVRQRRELKWVHMLQHWDRFMARHYAMVRRRCRKGIPSSVRARAWSQLCGGHYLMANNGGVFERLCETPVEPDTRDQIVKDLHRQFPRHEMFAAAGGAGQRDLLRVLCAYVTHRPRDGYSQAQAPVAALLLMHMPACLAFWCLVAISDNYLPGYYGPSMEQVLLDGCVLHRLLRRSSPQLYRHVTRHQLEPPLYMLEWFMCVYSRTLPWPSVLRVWDMFLCEGVRVLFAVALVLLRCSLEERGKLGSCDSLADLLQRLHRPPEHVTAEAALVARVCHLELSRDEITAEYRRELAARRRDARKRDKQQRKREKQRRKPETAGS